VARARTGGDDLGTAGELGPHVQQASLCTPPRSIALGSLPEPSGWQDVLTGLDGPDLWQRVLVSETSRAYRYKRALTVVVIELAGVETIASAWGTDVARHCVREAAQCLRRMARTSDYCARVGPERFGVILTETDEIAAINFVERVREAGPRAMPRGGEQLRFTFGWASPRSGESADAVVRRATDRLLADISA
jgi:diguanylate cyclase (GGDEF)-like protein